MSKHVHFKGVLKLYKRLENENLEKLCRRVLESEGYFGLKAFFGEHTFTFSNYQELLEYRFPEKYIVADGNLYEILAKETINAHDDIFEAKRLSRLYIFEVKYYDGGCSFKSAIEQALKGSV